MATLENMQYEHYEEFYVTAPATPQQLPAPPPLTRHNNNNATPDVYENQNYYATGGDGMYQSGYEYAVARSDSLPPEGHSGIMLGCTTPMESYDAGEEFSLQQGQETSFDMGKLLYLLY